MSIKRILTVLITAAFMFVALSVLIKLVLGNDNWFVLAGIWTSAWIVGSMVAILFCQIKATTITLFFYDVGVISFVLITLAFILGVLLKLSGWAETLTNIAIPFGMAIFVYSGNKKE